MHATTPLRRLFLAFALLLPVAALAAGTPKPFTATYQVMRNGSTIGTSTLTLHANGNGTWIYASRLRGTAGLAGLLGATLSETSHFRWRNAVPEAMSYDYRMHTLLKSRQRTLRVDWNGDKVRVEENGKQYSYAPRAGMIERHCIPLALGYALADGRRKMTLPVGVRNRVEMQRYAVTASAPISVPAGRFDAVRVDRTDDRRNFTAWYVPGRYPVPVKLAQHGDDDITILLQSYRTN